MEAGVCDGEKQATIHYAQLMEPGERWIIISVVEEPLRGFKPRLSKCEVNEPWPIATSPEPLRNSNEIDDWVHDQEKIWEEKGYDVKLRQEKSINLN